MAKNTNDTTLATLPAPVDWRQEPAILAKRAVIREFEARRQKLSANLETARRRVTEAERATLRLEAGLPLEGKGPTSVSAAKAAHDQALAAFDLARVAFDSQARDGGQALDTILRELYAQLETLEREAAYRAAQRLRPAERAAGQAMLEVAEVLAEKQQVYLGVLAELRACNAWPDPDTAPTLPDIAAHLTHWRAGVRSRQDAEDRRVNWRQHAAREAKATMDLVWDNFRRATAGQVERFTRENFEGMLAGAVGRFQWLSGTRVSGLPAEVQRQVRVPDAEV